MAADRVVSWQVEMRVVHNRIVRALADARIAVAAGRTVRPLSGDLQLHCHHFCSVLDGHHRAEDEALFPRLTERTPRLAATIERFVRDHATIAGLLVELESSLSDPAAHPDDLMAKLDEIEAVMKSHFADEERSLNAVLQNLVAPASESEIFFGRIAAAE